MVNTWIHSVQVNRDLINEMVINKFSQPDSPPRRILIWQVFLPPVLNHFLASIQRGSQSKRWVPNLKPS